VGLVYVYVVAWVLGGVLLGGRLLLAHREPDAPLTASGSSWQGDAAARSAHVASLIAIGLVGFGLFGLLAEGLGFGAAPAYTALGALGTAAGLSGAAHLMMRARRRPTDAV
jgi:hypothetical protein